MGGTREAADIINGAGKALEKRVMSELIKIDKPLARKIEEEMFKFEHLFVLEPMAMGTLLRDVPNDTLIDALKGIGEEERNQEPQPRPEWATRLSNEQQQTVTQDMQKAHNSDGGDWLIMLMAWSVPGYFILQTWIWRRWHDNWRRAGLLPLWASIPITGYTLFALLMGSNLWPLVMLFVLPVLFGYLLVIATIRMIRQQ